MFFIAEFVIEGPHWNSNAPQLLERSRPAQVGVLMALPTISAQPLLAMDATCSPEQRSANFFRSEWAASLAIPPSFRLPQKWGGEKSRWGGATLKVYQGRGETTLVSEI